MTFYDKFEELCKKKDVTPTQVARESGITQQAVPLWKTRGSVPKISTVRLLAEYFGVNTMELLLADDEELLRQKHEEDEDTKLLLEDREKWRERQRKRREQEERDMKKRIEAALYELTNEGKRKVTEYAEDLVKIPQYRRWDAPPAPSEGRDTTPAEPPTEGPQENK